MKANSTAKHSDPTTEFDSQSLHQAIRAGKPVLADFYANWCGPCQALKPTIDRLRGAVGDAAVVGKVNIDEHAELANEFDIQPIPTLIVFRNGLEAQRFVGVSNFEELEHALLTPEAR